jgi:hypothetical protein
MANISRFFCAAATAIIVLCLGGCGEGRGKLQLWLRTPNAENSSLRRFSLYQYAAVFTTWLKKYSKYWQTVCPENADARPLTWLTEEKEKRKCLIVEVFPCSQVDFFPKSVWRAQLSLGENCQVLQVPFKALHKLLNTCVVFSFFPLPSPTGHLPPSTSLTPSFLIPCSEMRLRHSLVVTLHSPRAAPEPTFPPRRVIPDHTDTPSRCSLIGYFQGGNPSTSQSLSDLNNILGLRAIWEQQQ